MNSVLDERFTLYDLLDPVILKEVCLAFAQCFELGLVIVGEKGEEVIAAGQDRGFCQMVSGGRPCPKCDEVHAKLRKYPVESTRVFQSKAFCGLRYALFPLYHQFEFLGRVILGPFRDTETSVETIQSLVAQETGSALSPEPIAKVPALDQERLKLIVRLLTRFLEAFIFVNAKRLITTRLHLEAVYSSRDSIFRQMEMQNTGTPEDKEEIEKLKSLF